MIKVKKIVNIGAGEAGIKCYKCAKNRASFYLMRETNDRPVGVPMCNVCLSAYLNFLDDRLIEWAYDFVHKDVNKRPSPIHKDVNETEVDNDNKQ